MNKAIIVKIPETALSSYPITIGNNLLSGIIGQLKKLRPDKKLFIITDTNVVKSGWLAKLNTSDVPVYIVKPAGESSKHIGTITKIIDKMEAAKLGRDCVIVALGGGVVGDMAGFAAAIYKRGVSVIQIPTTTISQADSAIGGKTGVDSKLSKNAYGCFHHPSAVFIDVDTLKTLDKRQYNCGLVESVKHALIADAKYFNYIQKNIDAVIARDPVILEYIALSNCRLKSSVVEADPYEKNFRRILNYGHTIGHAVESASKFKILHGQAVAIGILAANIIEDKLGLGGKDRIQPIKELFKKLEVDLRIPADITKQQILDIISRDKKAVNAWPRFVLLEKIGKVHCQDDQYACKVSRPVVEETIEIMLEGF